jgi:hypothetical protein
MTKFRHSLGVGIFYFQQRVPRADWREACNIARQMNYIPGISWQDSDQICALADSDRHLGHLIRTDRWYAYDATRLDEKSNGFKCLGAFPDLDSAKRILELAVWNGHANQTVH